MEQLEQMAMLHEQVAFLTAEIQKEKSITAKICNTIKEIKPTLLKIKKWLPFKWVKKVVDIVLGIEAIACPNNQDGQVQQ